MGSMMRPAEFGSERLPLPAEDQLLDLAEEDLAALAAEWQAVAAESERAFARARDRFDRDRKALRALEGEVERRRLVAAGEAAPPMETRVRRKRSTTGMDALLGRDGIDMDAPLGHFHFFSLQRQEILLSPAYDPARQALGFVDSGTGELHEARTFGEARRLHEAGHKLGRPGIPLQRQAIWYIGEGKPGWLRLDQMFVEQEGA